MTLMNLSTRALRARALFLATAIALLTLGTSPARSQAGSQTGTAKTVSAYHITGDVAFTYTAERAKTQPSNCGCFWLGGGGADGVVTFYKGLGLVGSINGEQIYSNLATGQGLNKFTYVGGPRYTYRTSRLFKKHSTAIFAEGLFGKVHGTNSIFPGPSGSTTQSTAFAMQAGIGADLTFHKGFGIRLFEVDYVYTQFPNNGSNTQDDLRLSAGLSYHFGKL